MEMMSNAGTRIIKASRLLQAKVGTGAIDDKKIRKCQTLIDDVDIDFQEMACDLLNDLKKAVNQAHEQENDHDTLIDGMTGPIMQIKGQASMFGYELLGELASVTLNFLESIQEIDAHVLEIMNAQLQTIEVILKNGIKGHGGEQGELLRQELYEACERYFNKKGISRKFVPQQDNDVFLVG